MPETEPKRIHISADSQRAKAMKDAISGGKRIVINIGEDEYSVYPDDNTHMPGLAHHPTASEEEKRALWEGYDAKRALDNFDDVEGSCPDIDVDELVSNIYRWREEGSRRVDRP